MKHLHFHTNPIVWIVFCGFFALLLRGDFFHESFSYFDFLSFIVLITATVFGIYISWQNRYKEKVKTFENLPIVFEKNIIVFPKGYWFKYSSIYEKKIIEAECITEINFGTSPSSLVIKGNEVIFMPSCFKPDLEAFGKRNNIPLVKRFDIWSSINEPFLDTEFEPHEEEATLKCLEENGLNREETNQIRKKIKWTMLSTNSLVWEWVYLGQFDYLRWTYLTRKKYWWSMEIALRNYVKRI